MWNAVHWHLRRLSVKYKNMGLRILQERIAAKRYEREDARCRERKIEKSYVAWSKYKILPVKWQPAWTQNIAFWKREAGVLDKQ